MRIAIRNRPPGHWRRRAHRGGVAEPAATNGAERAARPAGGAAGIALALVMCALAGAAAPVGAQTETPAATRDTIPRRSVGALRPGDLLKVVVFRDRELTGEYAIDAGGFVQIPGLGVIEAAGLDPTQVTERLRDALIERGFARPEISVQPLIRVSVLGEVRTPNVYPVDPGTSLLQLLTLAGGPSDRANLRDTRVIRDGRAFQVDLESALRGSAAGRIVLYSNDVIVVGRRRGFTAENLGVTASAVSIVVALLNVIFLIRQQ